jgi:hypothetical protein
MSVARTVPEVIRQHVTLEVESIDRLYLNVYQPKLPSERGVASLLRFHRGHTVASSALMDPKGQGVRRCHRAFRPAGSDPADYFCQGATQRGHRPWGTGPSSKAPRASSLSARPRRRHRSSVPRNAPTPKPGRNTPGSSALRPWSITFTSMPRASANYYLSWQSSACRSRPR